MINPLTRSAYSRSNGVAGLFGVNVGSLILWGIVMAIPMTIAAIIYAKYIGKNIPDSF